MNNFTFRFLFAISFVAIFTCHSFGQTMIPLPGYVSTYTGNSRGFWFQAPTTFYVTGLKVPTDVGTGNSAIHMVKFTAAPPAYATVTTAFTTLYYGTGIVGTGIIPVNIQINSGDFIGIIGVRNNGSGSGMTSYGTTGAFSSSIGGIPTTITRVGWQGNIITSPAVDFWQEVGGNVGRIEVYYQLSAPGGIALPPIANFFPSQSTTSTIPTDTVWINSPFDLVATSTNATRSYWDLPGETTLNPGYSRTNVGFTSQLYIDTAKYSTKFRYTFGRRGFWPVRLLSINDYKRDSLRDSIVKYIWVDTPSRAPVPNFFSARTKIGIADYASMVDISSYGPNQWYWTIVPDVTNVPNPYFANFFSNPLGQNPLLFGGFPGKYAICLQVWNARGWDTICKQNYIEVINSVNMCSGSGSTSSSWDQGFVFGPSGPAFSYTRSQVLGCPGFLLNPCADSIFLFVDRIKMLPTDTLVIHNGTSQSAPIIGKLGAASVGVLPQAIINNGIRGGNRLFLRFMTGNGTIPNPYDSAGFSIRWAIKGASYGIPQSHIVVPDTIYHNQPVQYSNTSTGTLMQYSWDTDGLNGYDSTGPTATRTFVVSSPVYRKICLVTYNCLGADTSCKNVLFLPTNQKPLVRFTVDKVQGFNTDTFRFTDQSLFGPSVWNWIITGGNYQAIMGTVKVGNVVTSRNPIIRFTQRTKYTVKLVATNQFGTDSLIKVDYINIGAYDQPQCLTDIGLADGSIGISRVQLQSGLDTAVNSFTPCYQMVLGNQSANMYRGMKHVLKIARPGISSPMDRKAWLDRNMDGLFTIDELVMNDMASNILEKTDTISISGTQQLGGSRLRVGVTYAGTQLNPSVLFLGVFRDYIVNFPMDTVKPSISLNGSSSFTTEIHKAFVDPGVISMDNIEGDISSKYITIGTVDTSKVGPNYLRYIVKDLYGNVSDTLNRTVYVILNQTGPSLTLNGSASMYVEVYKKYTEPGYVAKDNQGMDISSQVVVSSNLDTSKLGAYSIGYVITDAFGFFKTASRAIVVGDTTRPVIVPPLNNIYIQQVGSAIDLAKVVGKNDNFWSANALVLTWQGSVDVNKVGTYLILYNLRDGSGNIGYELAVEVRVRDTKVPNIYLNGSTPLTAEVFSGFADPWVTVSDNYWPTNTIVVTKKGAVNMNVLGSYTIWYIATDPSGNQDSVSREIRVVDTTKPIINLLGITEINLPRWKEYIDPPVQLSDNHNTDSLMRPFLIIINTLPLNSQGKPFGDVPGLFSVRYKVKDLSGNESSEAKRTINVLKEGPSGISDLMNIENLMSVYPNPSNGLIYVRLVDVQKEDVQVFVLDMLGKEVMHIIISKNNLQTEEIDLQTSSKGFYLLKVQTGDHVYMKKLQVN